MSCYHPLAGIAYYGEYSNEDTKSRKYHIYGSWHPEYKNDKRFADAIKIPCGHCIGCILDKARSWSDRMMLEYYTSGRGLFITLTYNNDHVPYGCDDYGVFRTYSLCKEDLQKFLKRVRKRFEPRELKFYAAGEYGPKTLRPHYHLVIFGLGLEDFPDIVEHGVNELGQTYYISESFGELWRDKNRQSIGFHILSEVSYKTCSYVARYTMKKAGQEQRIEYAEPEFHVMSRRPGLGFTYLKRFPDCMDNLKIDINDGSEQKLFMYPSIFIID